MAFLSGHVPVLVNSVSRVANSILANKILDTTFGGGGYTRAFLKLATESVVWAIDRDSQAAARAKQLASLVSGRFHFCPGKFSNMHALDCAKAAPFDLISFDLGLCTDQVCTHDALANH